jgi:hypothetical protein
MILSLAVGSATIAFPAANVPKLCPYAPGDSYATIPL